MLHAGLNVTVRADWHHRAAAALEAERQSLDRGIDAWKRVVATAPTVWAPRRELARVYKQAERWKPYRSVAAWYLWRAAEDKGLVTTDAPVAAAKPRKRSASARSTGAKKSRAKQKSRTS